MIMLGSNQYLTFNPKRQHRTDKQPRQGLQLRFKTSQQAIDTHLRQPIINQFKQEDAVQKRFQPYSYQKQHNYDISESKSSQRLKEVGDISQSQRKRDDIIKRVKQLQNMVLPLVDRQEKYQDRADVGWQSKIQRKMLRIQSSLDSVRKEWQIQMEKKLMKFDSRLEQRYMSLKIRKDNNDPKFIK